MDEEPFSFYDRLGVGALNRILIIIILPRARVRNDPLIAKDFLGCL